MKQYVVDAFTDRVFSGNPAAVCVTEQWLTDDVMQKITWENNLSETAFAAKEGEHYCLRWFTPGGEIDLCGHATLATAFVILSFYEKDASTVCFTTRSGELTVTRRGELLEMDFPAYELAPVAVTEDMTLTAAWEAAEATDSNDPPESPVKNVSDLLIIVVAVFVGAAAGVVVTLIMRKKKK